MKFRKVTCAIAVSAMIIQTGCSKNLDTVLSDADSLASRGNIEEAISGLKETEKEYASDTTAVMRIRTKMVDIYGYYGANYSAAISMLAESIDRYPDRPETAGNLFKLAFTYETLRGDLKKAREYYELFLQRYPGHELAESVRVNLEHLGESEEDMLKRILEKAAKDSASKKAP